MMSDRSLIQDQQNDVKLAPFTVFRKSTKIDLFVRVNASLELLDSLKV